MPAALAFVFGWLAFRSRVTGVYLSIITQALSYALMLAFFRNDMGFGGNNGFTDFKDMLGFDLQQDRTRAVLLAATAVALAASYLACRLIVASRAGRVVRAIRDAESRTRFLGYPVESYKLWVFVFSAVIAGVAGALYVPQVGIINPSEFAPINSIEVVIWVAVGGRGTLYGAARARSSSTTRRRTSPAPSPKCGSTRSGRCSCWSPSSFRAGWPGSLPAGDAKPMTRPRCPRGHHRGAGGAATATGTRTKLLGIVTRRRGVRRRDASRAARLYLENVTVSFDGFKALNGLTLYVDPGELRCIIGPNGAGKTTMMDVITGKTRPDHGSAWFGRASIC